MPSEELSLHLAVEQKAPCQGCSFGKCSHSHSWKSCCWKGVGPRECVHAQRENHRLIKVRRDLQDHQVLPYVFYIFYIYYSFMGEMDN